MQDRQMTDRQTTDRTTLQKVPTLIVCEPHNKDILIVGTNASETTTSKQRTETTFATDMTTGNALLFYL